MGSIDPTVGSSLGLCLCICVLLQVENKKLSPVNSCRSSKCVGRPFSRSMGPITESFLANWASIHLLSLYAMWKNTPHLTFKFFQYSAVIKRSFSRRASTTKLLNISKFFEFPLMLQWHIEKGCAWMSTYFSADLISSLGVNMAQCSLPQLMESHSAVPLRQANWGSFYLSLHYNMLWSQSCRGEKRTGIHGWKFTVLESL